MSLAVECTETTAFACDVPSGAELLPIGKILGGSYFPFAFPNKNLNPSFSISVTELHVSLKLLENSEFQLRHSPSCVEI
eukprot:3395752-Amphidinium_carterae.1